MITPEELLSAAKELEPQLREWRRTLHRHPEVGFELPQTKALVKKALTEMGYAPQDCGRCGVLALAGGKRPGKTILLRGDMDALLPTDLGQYFLLFGWAAATAATGGEQEHGQRACQKQGNDLGKLLHRVSLQSDDFVDMFRSSEGCAPFGVLLLP